MKASPEEDEVYEVVRAIQKDRLREAEHRRLVARVRPRRRWRRQAAVALVTVAGRLAPELPAERSSLARTPATHP